MSARLPRYEWCWLADIIGGDDAAFRRLEVDHRQVDAYRAKGLTPYRADVLAHRIGLHPAQVWPWWGCDIDETYRLRANAIKRRWRRTPAGRASELRSQEKWRAECREYKRARDRANAAKRDRERKREIDRAYWARHRDRLNATRKQRRAA